jgi:hypothetical protein
MCAPSLYGIRGKLLQSEFRDTPLFGLHVISHIYVYTYNFPQGYLPYNYQKTFCMDGGILNVINTEMCNNHMMMLISGNPVIIYVGVCERFHVDHGWFLLSVYDLLAIGDKNCIHTTDRWNADLNQGRQYHVSVCKDKQINQNSA